MSKSTGSQQIFCAVAFSERGSPYHFCHAALVVRRLATTWWLMLDNLFGPDLKTNEVACGSGTMRPPSNANNLLRKIGQQDTKVLRSVKTVRIVFQGFTIFGMVSFAVELDILL